MFRKTDINSSRSTRLHAAPFGLSILVTSQQHLRPCGRRAQAISLSSYPMRWQPSNFEDNKTEGLVFFCLFFLTRRNKSGIAMFSKWIFLSNFWLRKSFDSAQNIKNPKVRTNRWPNFGQGRNPLSCSQSQNGGRLTIIVSIFKIKRHHYFCSRNRIFQNSTAAIVSKARLFYIRDETWNRLIASSYTVPSRKIPGYTCMTLKKEKNYHGDLSMALRYSFSRVCVKSSGSDSNISLKLS